MQSVRAAIGAPFYNEMCCQSNQEKSIEVSVKQQSTIEGNATTSSFNIQHLPLLLSITHQLLITPTHDEVATNQPHVGYIICKHQAVTPFSSTADASSRKVGKDNQDLVANNIHNGAHSYVVGSIYFHVCGI